MFKNKNLQVHPEEKSAETAERNGRRKRLRIAAVRRMRKLCL